MATEKVVTREVPVEREVVVRERGGMGAAGIIIALIVLAAVVLGGVFLINAQKSESVKDNAIAGAADSVSGAADAVTDAVTPK